MAIPMHKQGLHTTLQNTRATTSILVLDYFHRKESKTSRRKDLKRLTPIKIITSFPRSSADIPDASVGGDGGVHPVPEPGHLGVDPRQAVGGTPGAPADHAGEGVLASLGHRQGPAAVPLARVLAWGEGRQLDTGLMTSSLQIIADSSRMTPCKLAHLNWLYDN